MGVESGTPLNHDLQKIRQMAVQAADLARKLLQFSRKKPKSMCSVSVNSIISNLTKMLQSLIGDNIKVSTELDPKIWAVSADLGSLEQVFMNLAVNAKATMPKGGKLLIQTENIELDSKQSELPSYAKPGSYARISVTDSGAGLNQKDLEHIFEPFYASSDSTKSTRLGLSVAYGIIRQHDGWISVKSHSRKGTTFLIYLPAIVKKKETTKAKTAAVKGSGERILIIEDEEDVRKLAIKALKKQGYSIFAAASGREAMDAFIQEGGNFHLVFSDIVLPDCNGIDLVKSFEDIRPGFKVLLSSGHAKYQSSKSQDKKTKFELLLKPYYLDKLVDKVHEIIKK